MQESFLRSIRNIMDKFKCTAEQAMDVLNIPVSERQNYYRRLWNQTRKNTTSWKRYLIPVHPAVCPKDRQLFLHFPSVSAGSDIFPATSAWIRNFSGHVRLPQEKFRRSSSHPGKNSAGPPLTPPNFRLRISSPSPLPLLYFSPSLFPPSHDDRRLFRPDFISHTGYNPKNTLLKKTAITRHKS